MEQSEDEPPSRGIKKLKQLHVQAQISQPLLKLKTLTIGNRIPSEFFIVQGSGESDLGYHPGAFDIALEKAGICNYNLVSYSSIKPKDAIQVSPPKSYVHGAVLESITAEAGKDKEYPKRLTAGIIITNVFIDGKLIGGLVAEYNGTGTKKECAAYLNANMAEMVRSRYGDDADAQSELFIESIESKSKYACAMVVMGFTSYKVPVLAIS